MKKYTTVKTVMETHRLKWIVKLVLALFVLSLFQGWFFLHPPELDSASLTSASVTMNNGRLSYRAGVGDTFPAGTITIDIDGSGNADNNTNPLFPGDTICFANSALSGCKNNRTYTAGTIVDTNTFTITDGLDGALENTDYVIATQSAKLTVTFTTASVIPVGGDILITIPAIQTANKTCDGFPDTAALASNGFDLKSVVVGDITATGCTDANWTENAPTCATGSNDHTIRIDRITTECAASSAITVTIGSTNLPIIPAPESSHTQFTADNYSITIQSRDGSDNVLDTVDVIAAPIEGVFVSATVPETLTFTIAAVGIGSTHCNADSFSTDVATTAYSVPFGTLTTSIGVETFSEAEQQLTVSTNADSGYKVYAEENDELGKDGSATTFIPDTPCDTSCDHTTQADWLNETINGFGYSLVNSSGTPAKFQYSTGGTWMAKHFPNEAQGATQFNATDAELMTGSTVASSESAYVCYRLSVDGAQEAGYYYNKITYIATPIF